MDKVWEKLWFSVEFWMGKGVKGMVGMDIVIVENGGMVIIKVGDVEFGKIVMWWVVL
nr:hypothetical protein [Staphylococcus auricularis]